MERCLVAVGRHGGGGGRRNRVGAGPHRRENSSSGTNDKVSLDTPAALPNAAISSMAALRFLENSNFASSRPSTVDRTNFSNFSTQIGRPMLSSA